MILTSNSRSFNNIESLNVKGYTSLSELYCTSCQLTILDLRGCDALYKMLCGYNQLSTLILPKESKTLRLVECNNNYLEGEFMDILVNSLPDRKNMTGGAFRVLGGFSGDQNVCTWQNIVDAKSKNWGTYVISPEDGSWILYTYDSPTTIRMAESDVDDDAPRYNMSGQRVSRDYRGVVIVNGRKVVK